MVYLAFLVDLVKTPKGVKDNLTNHVPRYVELTLYLEPLQEGETPVEMKRCVDIPVARTPNGMR